MYDTCVISIEASPKHHGFRDVKVCTLDNDSIMTVSGTSQPLSTCHLPCNQLFLSLCKSFSHTEDIRKEHCPNTSAADPSAICKKSAKELRKLDKDSLQSNNPVLGLSMSTLSERTDLLWTNRITQTKFVTKCSSHYEVFIPRAHAIMTLVCPLWWQ